MAVFRPSTLNFYTKKLHGMVASSLDVRMEDTQGNEVSLGSTLANPSSKAASSVVQVTAMPEAQPGAQGQDHGVMTLLPLVQRKAQTSNATLQSIFDSPDMSLPSKYCILHFVSSLST